MVDFITEEEGSVVDRVEGASEQPYSQYVTPF